MRDVPEDEAEEVRTLLNSHDIEYFETFAGNWGISMPALWIKEVEEFDRARELIDRYQAQRSERISRELAQGVGSDGPKTLKESFMLRPFQFLAHWLLIAVVLFISIYYFFTL